MTIIDQWYGGALAVLLVWCVYLTASRVRKPTDAERSRERWGMMYRIAYVPMRDRYVIQFPREHWETHQITKWETLEKHNGYVSYDAAAVAADGLYAAKLRENATEEVVTL